MTVSSTTNKVSASGNGTQDTFAYTFKIFADGDLKVFVRDSEGTETLKTITTHYTVTGAGSESGGNVVFTSGNIPASTEDVIIQRKLNLTQGTDYVENDPFPAESHEEALDRLTFITQQMQEEIDRSIKASVTNTITSTEFTIDATNRANKVFAFDSSGNLSVAQELGTFRGDWAASRAYNARDLVKDTSTNNIFLANTAHTSSGSQPLTSNTDSAKWDLIVDAASASTSATAAASSATASASSATAAAASATTASGHATTAETHKNSAETAKTAAETAKTAAETAQAAAETALDNFDDVYLGAKASDPTVDNDGDALNAGDLYFNTTSDALKVYNGSSWDVVAQGTTLAAVVDDTTPQLGGNLDTNGNDIVTTSNANLDLAPNGTGKVVVRGNTNSGALVLNCEQNTHGQTIIAQPHSASVTNVLTLPAGSDQELVGASATQTLTNKTIGVAQLSGQVAISKGGTGSSSASAARTALGLAIGSDVQAFDADTLKADVADTLTAPFRGAVTAENDGSFDLNAGNNFTCTPTGAIDFTFTNETAGQSGMILLTNTTPQTITVDADVHLSASDLTAINVAGTYLMSYYCPDGTNVFLSTTPALTEGS